jgi:hypothetical protein
MGNRKVNEIKRIKVTQRVLRVSGNKKELGLMA